MPGFKDVLKKAVEYALPWLVLAVLLAYSYAYFFQRAYGFRWGTQDAIISRILVNEREPTIHVGDKLVQVGSVTLQSFKNNLRQNLFEGTQPGQVVPITVERGGQLITVQWRLPGPTPVEQREQLFGPWFLAYFFWVAGTVTVLVLRPRDERRFLMAAFNFLTAISLITGSGLSFFHIWYSALVLRMAVWMSVPVYLHLHWVFPRPLGKLPRPAVWAAYALAAAMAGLQWFQLLPSGLYSLGFVMALVGSVVLLLIHAERQPDMRRDLRMLLMATSLAVAPTVTLAIAVRIRGSVPPAAALALLSLPILPFAYLYAAYRSQLGGLELRVNRLITIYAFLILLGVVMVPLLVIIDQLPRFSADQTLITGIIASILVTAVSLGGFPLFQRLMERRLLGIAVPSKDLQQTYSSHITSSTSLPALTQLLEKQIMPSLLVRQFVFLVLDDGSTRVLLQTGVSDDQIPRTGAREVLAPLVGKRPAPLLPEDPHLAWIRLVLPLRVEDDVLGFWLFGRRDPDDLYSLVELPVLESFANQTAIALSNILQTERLRSMYEADINRHENERLGLARDLHDSVLSELAGMLMNTDVGDLPKSFQEGYQALIQRVREIVRELRPPMLNYGLKPAIEELADNLMERSKEAVTVVVKLESNGERYAPDKEQHLFRIVQEACENALRHSNGKTITVSGQLAAGLAEVSIEDDGYGFELGKQNIDLYDLLSQRHFGLAGMFERAELIQAEIRITSAPGAGTRIFVRWPKNGKRWIGRAI